MSKDVNAQGTTLVLSGTGRTGRRVAGRLRARDVRTQAAGERRGFRNYARRATAVGVWDGAR
jgi:phosphoglycerate dehydrogenase-like enzyme